MIHHKALDPIQDDTLNRFSLKELDVFNTSLLGGNFRDSEVTIVSYDETAFSYKLNVPSLIHFSPYVTVSYQANKQEVSIEQGYNLRDRTYQYWCFLIILIVGAMFIVLPVIGGLLDFILEKKTPISSLADVGAFIALICVILSAYGSLKFFMAFREKFWVSSRLKTIELLNLIGVASLHSYDQTAVIRRRFSDT